MEQHTYTPEEKKPVDIEIETRKTLKLYEERNIISGICKILSKISFVFGRTFFILSFHSILHSRFFVVCVNLNVRVGSVCLLFSVFGCLHLFNGGKKNLFICWNIVPELGLVIRILQSSGEIAYFSIQFGALCHEKILRQRKCTHTIHSMGFHKSRLRRLLK